MVVMAAALSRIVQQMEQLMNKIISPLRILNAFMQFTRIELCKHFARVFIEHRCALQSDKLSFPCPSDCRKSKMRDAQAGKSEL